MSVHTILSACTAKRVASAFILTTCVFGSSLFAADAAHDSGSVADEDSVIEKGKWSESAIAKGQNNAIDEDALKTLPPNVRNIWGTQADKKAAKKARGKRQAGQRVVDEVIPAFGVTYVTRQRDYSRGENLFHRVQHFLTDVNIRVMAGELGRRGPQLVAAKDENGGVLKNGDVALVEREPLPEEVHIREFYTELITMEKIVAYPNSTERHHFNEIAGALGKAQGLLNFDLTEEGIQTIDEQYTAWRVLIEVEKQKALEIVTQQIMEEKGTSYKRARREAEGVELEFKLPPLPMGKTALRDARAELNRLNGVTAAHKTKNAKTKRIEKIKEALEKPQDIEVHNDHAEKVNKTPTPVVEEEHAHEEKEHAVVEEVVEEAVEEEVIVEEVEIDIEEDMDIEEEVIVEEAPAKEEETVEEEDADDFEFDDDF